MATVLKFPDPKRNDSKVELPKLDLAKVKAAMPSATTLKGVLAVLWLVVRLPLFLVLYWLRLPVVFVCNLVSIPLLLGFLFVLYAFPDKTNMLWGFGATSFGAFVVMWTYDYLLMALSPQQMMRSL